MTEIMPVEWPDPEEGWWWMRYRRSRRAKWRVLLVEVVKVVDRIYVRSFEGRNYYPRSVCRSMEVRFLPAVAPPKEWQ